MPISRPIAFATVFLVCAASRAAEVPLLIEADAKVIAANKEVGHMVLPAGTMVAVLSTNAGMVTVRRGAATLIVPEDSIAADELAASLEQAAHTAPPRPAATPSAKPSPTKPFASPSPPPRGFHPEPRGDEMVTRGGDGGITFTFFMPKEASAEERNIFEQMDKAAREAVDCYNENTKGLRKELTLRYSPGTPTADGNINGNIRLGTGARNQRVIMHEIAHTLGVGTAGSWGNVVQDGVFTGKKATEALREATGDKDAVLKADRMHIWPYGLNYDSEVKSPKDFVTHCKIVQAIVEDLR